MGGLYVFSDVKCLFHSVLGIQRRRMDNSSTVTYTEDNYTEPVLPDNPIRV